LAFDGCSVGCRCLSIAQFISNSPSLSLFLTRNCSLFLACVKKADLRVASYRVLLECLYVLAHLLAPLLPVATTEILKRLGTSARPAADLSANFDNLAAGTPVKNYSTLKASHLRMPYWAVFFSLEGCHANCL
jgi:isoleucyl-tRNA synthetase